MLSDNVKNILIAVFAAFLIIEIGSIILYRVKTGEFPSQYSDLIENWKGWVVIVLGLAGGAGLWYILDKNILL